MSQLTRQLRQGKGFLLFWCPGCNSAHRVTIGEHNSPRWGYNENPNSPTFTPSILVTWKEPSDVEGEFDDPSKDVPKVCHSFVTDGNIQFLTDCTHALAGTTVPLPDWPQPDGWED